MAKIDDDIPLPPLFETKYTRYQAIVETLSVGQSFFIETDKVDNTRTLVLKCALRSHVKCTTRRWEQDGKAGIRVWRIE